MSLDGQAEKVCRQNLCKSFGYFEQFCVGYEYMGLMYQTQRKYDQAIREFAELIKRCPSYPNGYLQMGKVKLLSGELTEGCNALETCRKHSRMTKVGSECDRLYRINCNELPKSGQLP